MSVELYLYGRVQIGMQVPVAILHQYEIYEILTGERLAAPATSAA